MIKQCCICKKILGGEGPEITHTFCETCYQEQMNEVNKYQLCGICQTTHYEYDMYLNLGEDGKHDLICQKCAEQEVK